MDYKLYKVEQIEPTINIIEQYDRVILYKSVRNSNGFFNKIRIGVYYIYDGDNICNVFCDKNILSEFKTSMNNRGYILEKGSRGKSR